MTSRSSFQFVVVSVTKFLSVWAHGCKASLNLSTSDGLVTVGFNCTLGRHPGAPQSIPAFSPSPPRLPLPLPYSLFYCLPALPWRASQEAKKSPACCPPPGRQDRDCCVSRFFILCNICFSTLPNSNCSSDSPKLFRHTYCAFIIVAIQHFWVIFHRVWFQGCVCQWTKRSQMPNTWQSSRSIWGRFNWLVYWCLVGNELSHCLKSYYGYMDRQKWKSS